jgi:hypothetical protein
MRMSQLKRAIDWQGVRVRLFRRSPDYFANRKVANKGKEKHK